MLGKLKILDFICFTFYAIPRHFMITNNDWYHFGPNISFWRRLDAPGALLHPVHEPDDIETYFISKLLSLCILCYQLTKELQLFKMLLKYSCSAPGRSGRHDIRHIQILITLKPILMKFDLQIYLVM